MVADAILEQARTERPPSDWKVWPLRREYVLVSAIKWGLLAIVGFAILIFVAMQMIPADFVGGDTGLQVFAVVLLALLASLAFGSAGIAGFDLWRLLRAHDYTLVLTPEVFVKATPGRVIETPLEHVTNVTLRGVPKPGEPTDSTTPLRVQARPQLGRYAAVLAPDIDAAVARRRARGPVSLAYQDARDNATVIVCTDDAFDPMYMIYEQLRGQASTRAEEVWRKTHNAR